MRKRACWSDTTSWAIIIIAHFFPIMDNACSSSPISTIIEFVNYVCNGIRDGFDTMITNADLLTFECRNNFSARSQPAIVKDLIDKECKKGFRHFFSSETADILLPLLFLGWADELVLSQLKTVWLRKHELQICANEHADLTQRSPRKRND
jgi:hypothetical protein